MLNNLKCVETNWNTYKINSKVIFENRQRRIELSVLATVQLNLPHLEIGAKRRERRKRERKRRSERDEEWGERRSKVKRCTSGAWNDITPEVTAFQYRKVTFNWRTNNHSPSSSESFLCVLTPPTFHEHVCHHLLRLRVVTDSSSASPSLFFFFSIREKQKESDESSQTGAAQHTLRHFHSAWPSESQTESNFTWLKLPRCFCCDKSKQIHFLSQVSTQMLFYFFMNPSLTPLCRPATWPTGWRLSSASPSALRPSFRATASTTLCWASTATAATDRWAWAAARTWWTSRWPTAHWENWWPSSRAPTRDTSTLWRR